MSDETQVQIWYRVQPSYMGRRVVTVEVVKETPAMVMVREHTKMHRYFKVGEFFKSFEEAKAYVIQMAQSRELVCKNNLSKAIQEREELEALQP